MQRAHIAILFLAILSIGAVCSPQDAATYLTDGTDTVLQEQRPVDFIIVLDRSGSMRGEKLEQAKNAAKRLVRQLTGDDRAAVVAFDSQVATFAQFSQNKSALEANIDRITVGDFTQYSQGLQRAAQLTSNNDNVIIFLSDGKPDDEQDIIDAQVTELVNLDSCIYSIAYADSADEEAQVILENIAKRSIDELSCGGYFRAGENEFDLQFVFQEIYQQVSSSDVFTVQASMKQNGEVSVETTVTSSINDRTIPGDACFVPEYEYVFVRNKEVIVDEISTESSVSFYLPPGEYEYFITVREKCGGDCLYSGSTEGTITINVGENACFTPWNELSGMLTNRERVEVQITDRGFSPQSVSTDGVVVWRNSDSKNHRIRGVDGSFVSPVLEPGDSWTRAFGPGSYAYVAENATFSGLLRNQNVPNHDPVDIVLVLDKSGSMQGRSLENAKQAALNLLSIMTTVDRAGFVVFSDSGQLVQPITSDFTAVRNGINDVVSEGSTFYIEALQLAGRQVSRTGGNRARLIIFLSDGAPFDRGGQSAILDTLDKELGDACLYTIGYGEQGIEAIELLESMADFVDDKNGCGTFFFSTTDKTELSKLFGEIYAQNQQSGLDVYDIVVPEELSGSFEVSALVRSLNNGKMVPSVAPEGCLPTAEVSIRVAGEEFPMEYENERYRATVSLPPGTYDAQIRARLAAYDQPARIILGSEQVILTVKGTNWPLWIAILFAVIALGYLFMRWRASHRYA